MSYCNQCVETKPILECVTMLLIGMVAPSENYQIYIENNNTGYLTQQDVPVDGSGILLCDLASLPEGFLNENSTYTLWSTVQGVGLNDYAPITINSEVYECFTLYFKKAFVNDEVANVLLINIEIA